MKLSDMRFAVIGRGKPYKIGDEWKYAEYSIQTSVSAFNSDLFKYGLLDTNKVITRFFAYEELIRLIKIEKL